MQMHEMFSDTEHIRSHTPTRARAHARIHAPLPPPTHVRARFHIARN